MLSRIGQLFLRKPFFEHVQKQDTFVETDGFLPKNFDPQRDLAIIAGKGDYPRLVLEQISGLPVYLIALEGETDSDLWESFPSSKRVCIPIGHLGRLMQTLQKWAVGYTLMVGQITPKRLFRDLKPDFKACTMLMRLKRHHAASLFGSVAQEISSLGIEVLDARAFLEGHLATQGVMCGSTPPIESGIFHQMHTLARNLADWQVGQGIVFDPKGTVLAVEAFEGTNAMLRRVESFGAKNPIFMKVAQVNQDYRFDVPVVGLHTLTVLKESGIRYVVLEAGRCLMLRKSCVLAAAKQHKISFFGLPPR